MNQDRKSVIKQRENKVERHIKLKKLNKVIKRKENE